MAPTEEVDRAALPGRAEDLGQGGLEAGMSVTDGQLHPGQAPGDQRAQKLAPEGLGLGLADIDADDLPPPVS